LHELSKRALRKLSAIVLSTCFGISGLAHAQALSTASRTGDLQVGLDYGVARSDYTAYHLKGIGFYSSFDFSKHYGVEVDFHQLDKSSIKLYERTYEVGGRYIPKQYGPLTPYAKVMYGRGVLNFPYDQGNVAYNMFVGGGGVEYAVKPWLKVRADVEYQDWLSGPGLMHGLTPLLGTIGVAYRFGSGSPKALQWDFPKQQPVKMAPQSPMPPKG
jgi:hypothetical protein